MQECSENILFHNMELFVRLNINAKMWKMGHYPIVEALRMKRERGRSPLTESAVDCVCLSVVANGSGNDESNVRENLDKFLSSSMEFYCGLLGSVESQLAFRVSDLVYDRTEFSSKTQRRKAGPECFVRSILLGLALVYPLPSGFWECLLCMWVCSCYHGECLGV